MASLQTRWRKDEGQRQAEDEFGREERMLIGWDWVQLIECITEAPLIWQGKEGDEVEFEALRRIEVCPE